MKHAQLNNAYLIYTSFLHSIAINPYCDSTSYYDTRSLSKHGKTGPHSAVGNVSGNRCESDYRSRGREYHIAQSVTCLATDASLTTDPGVVSSIPAQSHTFVEIDHRIISTVILLPSAESFKKGCCQ